MTSAATAVRPLARPRPAIAGGCLAVAGLVAVAASSVWLVAAAAQRASVLSPPTMRAVTAGVPVGGWLLGPLRGLLPGLAHDPARLHRDLAIALVVMLGGWLLTWATAAALPLRAVAAATGALQALFVLGPPQPLTDVFNYVVYGQMAAHGVNPYRHVPAAGPHGTAYLLANWHHLRSPYGPLFTLLCVPLGVLPVHVALWAWKAVVLALALGALGLVAWLARRLGRSPQRAVACVGLCPVTLAYGVGGLHNDLPAITCLLGAVACLLAARDGGAGRRADAAAGALAVAAAGFKPSFAIAVPLVLLGCARRPAALAGAAAAGAAILAVVGLVFGGALPDLGAQSGLVTPLSIPNLAGIALGHHGADATVRALGRDVLTVVAIAAVAAVAWRRRLALPALGVVLVAAVLTLSWVMPWYLAWGLPFVALGTPRALVPVAVAAAVWLGVGGSSQLPQLLHHFGYFPTRTATGRANHQYTERLLK